jgi:hypothetical protein
MIRFTSGAVSSATAFCVLAMSFAAMAQYPVMPTKPSGTYDQSTWTPVAIGSCTGTGAGCTSVNGFAWFPDGRMVLLTNDYLGQDQKPNNRPRSKVSIITNPGTGSATVQTVASHFKQPAGVTVVNDRIWVPDMDTVYTVTNNNPAPADTISNRTPRFRTPLSTDYNGHLPPLEFKFNKANCSGGLAGCTNTNSQAHHYIFTPVYYQGKFYASYGDATGSGTGLANLNSSSYYGGALLVWDSTTTQLDTIANRSFAGGFRSPNGTALGPDGSIFVSDHQGAYLPMNTITRFKVGATKMQYGGYRLAPGFTPNFSQAWYERGDADYVPPLAINRYRRSPQMGWVGIGQPYFLTQGPYAGQILVGDINSRGLWRVALDTLTDTSGAQNVQGAVFTFTPGNQANTLGTGNAGINRITQGPDGTIYAGAGRGIGNWGGGPSQHLIYVFKPKANPTQFEIMNIRSLADGYELVLNKKVNPATVNKAHFSVGQRSWVRQAAYGLGFSPNNDPGTTDGVPTFTNRVIDSVQVSLDSMSIRLKVSGILRINQSRRGDTVTHWHTRFLFNPGIRSVTGDSIYTTEADYAQNWINTTRTWNGGSVAIDTTTPSDTDTVVSLRPRINMLGNNVWLARSPGVIRVNVDNMGQPYQVVLRSVSGRVLFRSSDIPAHVRATEIKAPGSTQAVYTIEVRSGHEAYTRIVTF